MTEELGTSDSLSCKWHKYNMTNIINVTILPRQISLDRPRNISKRIDLKICSLCCLKCSPAAFQRGLTAIVCSRKYLVYCGQNGDCKSRRSRLENSTTDVSATLNAPHVVFLPFVSRALYIHSDRYLPDIEAIVYWQSQVASTIFARSKIKRLWRVMFQE